MSKIAKFTFNPFQENTYVLYDPAGGCIVIDPGCSNEAENQKLADFIEKQNLTPEKLINTHCHVDHVLGNKFVADKYGLELGIHNLEEQVLKAVPEYGTMLGLEVTEQKAPDYFIEPGTSITFGDGNELEVLFVPGHSPGSIAFYNKKLGYVISGDALFYQSIGRTDLPGGHHQTLIDSIKKELLVLPEKTVVCSGHGPETTIGQEKSSNPFLN